MDTIFRDCLDDLADRLQEDQEHANCEAWRQFLFDEWDTDVFTPPPRAAAPAAMPWPRISPAEAAADVRSMMLAQFAACSDILASGAGSRLGVSCTDRAALLPSLFGCKAVRSSRGSTRRVTIRPVRSMQALTRLLDAGVPDIRTGLAGRAFEAVDAYAEVFDRYHAVGQHVSLHHPTVPNSLGLLVRVAGPKRFGTIGRDPGLLHDLLALTTNTLCEFLQQWYVAVPHRGETTVHGRLAFQGRVLLRIDLSRPLDAAFYARHVARMDQAVLQLLGGGVVLLAGKAHQLIDPVSTLIGLTGVVLDGPAPADMDAIYRCTIDKGIKLLAMDRQLAANAGRPLRGQVHCP